MWLLWNSEWNCNKIQVKFSAARVNNRTVDRTAVAVSATELVAWPFVYIAIARRTAIWSRIYTTLAKESRVSPLDRATFCDVLIRELWNIQGVS